MTMGPRVRKVALTAHVAASVGWLGAVIVVVGLSVVALTSQDAQTVRGAYLVLEPVGWYVLVPLGLLSLLTGLVQSLGTHWGLARHYWVLAKLSINVVASIVLLLYMRTLGYLADLAATTGDDLGALRTPSPLVHSVGASTLLLVATTLSVVKPRGLTRYGQRQQQRSR